MAKSKRSHTAVKPHNRKLPGPRKPPAAPMPGANEFGADDEQAMRKGQRAANMMPPDAGGMPEDDFGGI